MHKDFICGLGCKNSTLLVCSRNTFLKNPRLLDCWSMLIYKLIPEKKSTIQMLQIEKSWADFSWPDPTKRTVSKAGALLTSIYLVSYLHSALTMQMGDHNFHQRSSYIGPTLLDPNQHYHHHLRDINIFN